MGYETDFEGRFKIEPKLNQKSIDYLKRFSGTRRMKRHFDGGDYGVDGEFFVDGEGFMGQDRDASVIDYNTPPKTQPSLWCQWEVSDCGEFIEWNGTEKFYDYIEWISYMINSFFSPNSILLNGDVEWRGEDHDDIGTISIQNNVITVSSPDRNEIITPKNSPSKLIVG